MEWKVGDKGRGPSVSDAKSRLWVIVTIDSVNGEYAIGQNAKARKLYLHLVKLADLTYEGSILDDNP